MQKGGDYKLANELLKLSVLGNRSLPTNPGMLQGIAWLFPYINSEKEGKLMWISLALINGSNTTSPVRRKRKHGNYQKDDSINAIRSPLALSIGNGLHVVRTLRRSIRVFTATETFMAHSGQTLKSTEFLLSTFSDNIMKIQSAKNRMLQLALSSRWRGWNIIQKWLQILGCKICEL